MDCENIKDFETIIWENRKEIVKGALDYASDICDGVAQIKVDTGELCYAGFTTGEVENPANRVVEVYRISQGLDKGGCVGCLFCDEGNGEGGCCNSEQLEECVVDYLLECFSEEFADVMSEVYCQIQEYGFDLN